VTRLPTHTSRYLKSFLPIFAAACTVPAPSISGSRDMPVGQGSEAQIARGRFLVISHSCGHCHGGESNPAATNWLTGLRGPGQAEAFTVGPFKTRARNLTPDNTTGTGRFSERQIFNSLRFGLRPGETPDVEITSATPGEGNFPLHPKYLAPPMPWSSWRHMPDEDLWAIAAYLKHGLKPVKHRVEDSEGPPDFWAATYTAEKIGAYPAPVYPTANEKGQR
jgi:mono/diheme cytochrome c family protein